MIAAYPQLVQNIMLTPHKLKLLQVGYVPKFQCKIEKDLCGYCTSCDNDNLLLILRKLNKTKVLG